MHASCDLKTTNEMRVFSQARGRGAIQDTGIVKTALDLKSCHLCLPQLDLKLLVTHIKRPKEIRKRTCILWGTNADGRPGPLEFQHGSSYKAAANY